MRMEFSDVRWRATTTARVGRSMSRRVERIVKNPMMEKMSWKKMRIVARAGSLKKMTLCGSDANVAVH